ncbi:MAG: YgiT-type zinc finger protein [Leptospiraceae bacterium]|nr:YgiT-type zinc finger protein [Leptospiraceae bacterium]
MKKKLSKCIHCGIGKTNTKLVEKILSSNDNTALVKVNAEVCDHCGERYYEPETIRYFERIKKELKNKSSKQLIPVGIAYKVAV